MGVFTFLSDQARNDSVSIGLTNTLVAEARTEANPRKAIVIRNISPNAADIITINLGLSTATANKGIVLKQYESFSDSSETGYECFQGTINGICATADGVVSIMER